MKTISETIIHTAMRLENIGNKHIFSLFGMTATSIKIMFVLKKCPECKTPTKILEIIGGTRSNISQRLDFLEKQGLVTRKHADIKSDKRKVILSLTSKGKKKLSEAEKYIEKANMYLEKYFSKKELAAHFAFMDRLQQVIAKEEKRLELSHNK